MVGHFSLPEFFKGSSNVVFNVMLFFSGGRSYYDETDTQTFYSEVLRYNATEDKWQKNGDMETPRYDHGASAVDWDVIVPFCRCIYSPFC